MKFPVPDWIDSYPFDTGMRRYGANRDGGARKHAGCDLYAPLGSPVVAISDGAVVEKTDNFYMNVGAVVINHSFPSGLIRYGEITVAPGIAAGSRVAEGQVIGYVARLAKHIHPMLHLEQFSGTATGPLSILKPAGGAFQRRKDLVDPTPILNQLKAFR